MQVWVGPAHLLLRAQCILTGPQFCPLTALWWRRNCCCATTSKLRKLRFTETAIASVLVDKANMSGDTAVPGGLSDPGMVTVTSSNYCYSHKTQMLLNTSSWKCLLQQQPGPWRGLGEGSQERGP